MGQIISFILDVALIGCLATGIYYAVHLSRQIAGLRASRSEMERFVMDFNATVQRAEAGIYGLKQAARTGGDDLEKQIERALALRDELHFLSESADQIATRLSDKASQAAQAGSTPFVPPPLTESAPAPAATPKAVKRQDFAPEAPSAAERDLLQALKRSG